jgi:hypothetical protein
MAAFRPETMAALPVTDGPANGVTRERKAYLSAHWAWSR